MAGYQKKIAYLDYLENGMKIKNAGFVRLEENNGQMRLEMRVRNIPEVFGGQYELKADTGGVVGRISLLRGSGSCCMVWKLGSAAAGKRLTEAGGVYVRLPGRHLLQAVWPEPQRLCVEVEAGETDDPAKDDGKTGAPGSGGAEETAGMPEDGIMRKEPAVTVHTFAAEGATVPKPAFEQEAAVAPVHAAMPEDAIGARYAAMPEDAIGARYAAMPESAAVPMRAIEPKGATGERPVFEPEVIAAPAGRAFFAEEEETPDRGNAASEKTGSIAEKARAAEDPDGEHRREEPVCYGDKWEQLSHMYAVIHPFGDGREYLSIAPKDFVVLRGEYQKMVHNSFLLHGYYNYRHLILGRIRKTEEWCYYLGVPGNFYGREKMVAEMFGFEAFEGEKEPAAPGDFGYFMKRVEI